MGYEREEKVEGRGQYSKRGGILDIFPVNSEMPCRIEFFDIEIDTMRWFSEDTQRSVEQCDELNIYPAREIVYSRDQIDDIKVRINKALEETLPLIQRNLVLFLSKILADILKSFRTVIILLPINLFPTFSKKGKPLDYIKGKHLVFFEESNRTRERMKNELEALNNLCDTLLEKGIILKDTFLCSLTWMIFGRSYK